MAYRLGRVVKGITRHSLFHLNQISTKPRRVLAVQSAPVDDWHRVVDRMVLERTTEGLLTALGGALSAVLLLKVFILQIEADMVCERYVLDSDATISVDSLSNRGSSEETNQKSMRASTCAVPGVCTTYRKSSTYIIMVHGPMRGAGTFNACMRICARIPYAYAVVEIFLLEQMYLVD